MKKLVYVLALPLLFSLNACAELQQVVNNLPTSTGTASSSEIGSGLKEALQMGVINGVTSLGAENGYFNDELTRILLPEELQKVDNTLRKVGLGSLADKGLKVLNTAASDAASEAKPIFINAIKNLSFSDAMGILTGGSSAATNYLKSSTSTALVSAFQPKIESSLSKVGANEIWSNIIQQYNKIPLVKPVEANLTNYVTEQAVSGMFKKIQQKENDIRGNTSSRTSALLQKVFAMQD